MESKTKVAGPLAAAGAVSLGLVLIGACGIGQEDTYVPPPPIHSGPQAAEPAQYTGDPATSVAKVLIPPSPSWRMAPEPPPRRTLPPEYQISVTASAGPGAEPGTGETTRPVTLSTTPEPSASAEPSWTTASLPSPPIEPAYTESPSPHRLRPPKRSSRPRPSHRHPRHRQPRHRQPRPCRRTSGNRTSRSGRRAEATGNRNCGDLLGRAHARPAPGRAPRGCTDHGDDRTGHHRGTTEPRGPHPDRHPPAR